MVNKLKFCSRCGFLLRGEKIEYKSLSNDNNDLDLDLYLKYQDILIGCDKINRNNLNICEGLGQNSKFIAYTTWFLNKKNIDVKQLKENSIKLNEIYSNTVYMFEMNGLNYGVLFQDIYLDKYNRYLNEASSDDQGFGFKLYLLDTNNAWWCLNYLGIIEYYFENKEEFFTKKKINWYKW